MCIFSVRNKNQKLKTIIMKKLFLPVIAVALLLNLKAQAQIVLIPNYDCEAWTAVASYENPTGWQTGNSGSTQLGGTATVQKSTDHHGGTYSMEILSSSTSVGFTFPGIAACGNITVAGVGNVSYTGGFPCATRVASINGWSKYVSGNSIDHGLMTAFLFKRTASGRDTIAIATHTFNQDTTWGAFTVNFTYQSGQSPDSALVIFTASDNLGTAQLGSDLKIDDLNLQGVVASVSSINNSTVAISVYPNPATENVHFAISNISTAKTLNIFDILGKKIKSIEVTSAQLSISTEGMNNSLYFYQVSDKNNNVISTGKFSVKK